MNLKLFSSPGPGRTRSLLKLLGLLILLGGLSAAGSLWLAQDRIERQRRAAGMEVAPPLAPEDSRRYTHDVELYYGQTGLLVDKWRRWWAEWTQGKPLAEVIAVASLLVASGLFYAGANWGRGPGVVAPEATQGPPGGKKAAEDDP